MLHAGMPSGHRLSKLERVYLYICMYVCIDIDLYTYMYTYVCVYVYAYSGLATPSMDLQLGAPRKHIPAAKEGRSQHKRPKHSKEGCHNSLSASTYSVFEDLASS